jgi:hypothetical protein
LSSGRQSRGENERGSPLEPSPRAGPRRPGGAQVLKPPPAGSVGNVPRPAAPARRALPPTGKRTDAPCCDVLELVDGRIKRFDCYPEGTIILTQLGVLGNLSAALEH